MDKYSISLIVIGSILIAIVARFIFNAAFRKDVIASEGEAKIFGLINVKGVIIVLLMAIFGGMFIYILDLSSKSSTSIKPVFNSDISTKHTSAQIFKKQAAWAIRHPDSSFSILSNENENGFFRNSHGLASTQNQKNTDSNGSDIQFKNRIWVGSIYQLKKCKLCFRIDSIINEQKNGTNYLFYVSFGEGILEQRDEIKWRSKNLSFNKSNNGRIDFENEMIALSANNWKKDYLLYCGFGQPNDKLESVEKVNIIALGSEIKLQ